MTVRRYDSVAMGEWEKVKPSVYKCTQVNPNAKSDIRNHSGTFEFICFHLGTFEFIWLHLVPFGSTI
jgi:hypothetical protein